MAGALRPQDVGGDVVLAGWVARRLDAMAVAEIENIADRLLDAPSLEDLLN